MKTRKSPPHAWELQINILISVPCGYFTCVLNGREHGQYARHVLGDGDRRDRAKARLRLNGYRSSKWVMGTQWCKWNAFQHSAPPSLARPATTECRLPFWDGRKAQKVLLSLLWSGSQETPSTWALMCLFRNSNPKAIQGNFCVVN